MPAPDAVELTVESAWYIADATGAGSFPWVLAITAPYRDATQRAAFAAHQVAELTRLAVMANGRINPDVRQWITIVCRPERWFELRYVGSGAAPGQMLRGIVARRGDQTVVALRTGQLVTFSALNGVTPHALAPLVTAGLLGRPPARFDEFSLPARAGARADMRLRDGADIAEVMDQLGIPASARHVVRSVFEGPRRYVEVVAGQHTGAAPVTTDVGIAVVDTSAGRVVVSPTPAFDGEWVSVFAPGTDLAVALAVESLTAALPDGRWFSPIHPVRDFTTQQT
jgi:hypothetical protein